MTTITEPINQLYEEAIATDLLSDKGNLNYPTVNAYLNLSANSNVPDFMELTRLRFRPQFVGGSEENDFQGSPSGQYQLYINNKTTAENMLFTPEGQPYIAPEQPIDHRFDPPVLREKGIIFTKREGESNEDAATRAMRKWQARQQAGGALIQDRPSPGSASILLTEELLKQGAEAVKNFIGENTHGLPSGRPPIPPVIP